MFNQPQTQNSIRSDNQRIIQELKSEIKLSNLLQLRVI